VDDLLTVRRWRRYGADRLYVTQENGAPLGSIDLLTGAVCCPADAEGEVRRAAQEYLRQDDAELVLPMSPTDDDEPGRLGVQLEAWLGVVGPDRTGPGSPVGERLDLLADDGWHVLHAVPLGRQGDVVDHLLLGPGGVLTVAERAGRHVRVCGRAMTVDGRPVAHLRDAELEAERVGDRFAAAGCGAVAVGAVVVVQGDVRTEGAVGEPLVVALSAVPGVFRAMPPVLDERHVRALASVARRRSTWTRDAMIGG
jgi:hypothetical protein